MISALTQFIRQQFIQDGAVSLHEPVFGAEEKKLVSDTIDSTFVSSVGHYVDRFEEELSAFVSAPKAVVTVNGTAALHAALIVCDVKPNDLVITQPLSFVATCNAISYCGAEPVFVDVDLATMGLSPRALAEWLDDNAEKRDGECPIATASGQRISACVPMHTFGHPVDIDGLVAVCAAWNIPIIEDAAEALGSFYKGQHVGTFGAVGTLSFNGNKIITTGGGGALLADEALAARAKHITTTAKASKGFEYWHDEVGYNYRMPNLNAALGCAQLSKIDMFISIKRQLAEDYAAFFDGYDVTFFKEPDGCRSNYWLNAVICNDRKQRDELLDATNAAHIMTRPVWRLMSSLPMFANCLKGPLSNAEWLEDRVVNLPSGVPSSKFS